MKPRNAWSLRPLRGRWENSRETIDRRELVRHRAALQKLTRGEANPDGLWAAGACANPPVTLKARFAPLGTGGRPSLGCQAEGPRHSAPQRRQLRLIRDSPKASQPSRTFSEISTRWRTGIVGSRTGTIVRIQI